MMLVMMGVYAPEEGKREKLRNLEFYEILQKELFKVNNKM